MTKKSSNELKWNASHDEDGNKIDLLPLQQRKNHVVVFFKTFPLQVNEYS